MRRFTGRLAVCAALLAVAGCNYWQVPGYDADQTNFNAAENTITAANVDQLEEKWTWVDDTIGPASVSSAVTSAGGVHVTAGCFVVTLDPSTGDQRWATPLVDIEEQPYDCEAPAGGYMSAPFTASAEADATHVLATFKWWIPISDQSGFWEHSSKALDASTGAIQGTPSNSYLAALRGQAIVSTYQSEGAFFSAAQMSIASLDGSIPARGWSVSASTFDITASPGWPTIGPGDLVFQSGPGAMTTTPGPSGQHYGVRAYSKTAATPGCTIQTPHPLYPTYDLECPVWVNPLDGTGSPTNAVLDNDAGTMFVVTNGGNMYALDQATGATLWTASGARSRPALADGLLWTSTTDGRLLTFDASGCGAATCSPVGEFDTGSAAALANPVVAGEVVYVSSSSAAGGSVFAFAKAGCSTPPCAPVWSVDIGAAYIGSPVVSQGQLFVSTGASLIAYGLPD